jgi:hypothetical protein
MRRFPRKLVLGRLALATVPYSRAWFKSFLATRVNRIIITKNNEEGE